MCLYYEKEGLDYKWMNKHLHIVKAVSAVDNFFQETYIQKTHV